MLWMMRGRHTEWKMKGCGEHERGRDWFLRGTGGRLLWERVFSVASGRMARICWEGLKGKKEHWETA